MADRDPILARVLPQEACFTRTFWRSMPDRGQACGADANGVRFLKEKVVGEAKQLVPDGNANVSRM